jgi:hypothetical protein
MTTQMAIVDSSATIALYTIYTDEQMQKIEKKRLKRHQMTTGTMTTVHDMSDIGRLIRHQMRSLSRRPLDHYWGWRVSHLGHDSLPVHEADSMRLRNIDGHSA